MDFPPRLIVGIDIGKGSADYALLASSGQILEPHRAFVNSLDGFRQAKQLLLETFQAYPLSGLDIAVEATSYYWLPLYLQLSQDPELAAYAPRLALLNAGWVKWFKKSFAPDHKSDQRDPFYIAERLRTLRQPSWWSYDPHWLRLRLLTRLRFHLAHSLSREKTHYQLFLFLAYSGYSRLKPFADPFGWTSQAVLAQPELLEEWRDLPVEELARQLDQVSGGRLPDPAQVADKLARALQESYPVPEELDPSLRSALRHLAQLVHLLQQQVDQVEGEIAALCQAEPYPEVGWLDSIPGVALVEASGLAAEIAGIARFAAPPKYDPHRKADRARNARDIEDAVAKFAGLWWPRNASGQFEAQERPLSRRGNAYLRYYLLLAADRMRLHIPSYTRYYQTKFREVSKHQHKRALVLTGRKAVGLIVGLLHHQEDYRPEEGAS